MTPDSQTAQLASFVLDRNLRIPDDVREASLIRLADCVAGGLAGVSQPVGEMATEFARAYRSAGEATVIGGNLRASADLAAFANGCIVHALDWDDFTNTNMHPTSVVLPAVMAIGETLGCTGAEVFESFIVGAEVAARLGRALNPAIFLRGFHPSGGVAAIAAAAGVGRLLDLTVEQAAYSFALALSGCGGVLANKGTMAKPIQVGNVGRGAVVAARLAAAGATASEDIISARHGIVDTMLAGLESGHDLNALTGDLGSRWELRRDWIIKPYPVGGGRLTLIEACIKLADVHDLDPREIDSVEVTASPFVLHVDHAHPSSAFDSRFSHAYCAAIALVDRAAGVSQFEQPRFSDPLVQEVVRRVRLIPDPGLGMAPANGEGLPSTVVVTTREGRSYRGHVARAKGEADRSATLGDVHQKLASCAHLMLHQEAADKLWSILTTLPQEPSLVDLMSVLAVRQPQTPQPSLTNIGPADTIANPRIRA